VTSWTHARPSWPLCNRGGSHSLVVYKDLLKDIGRESNQETVAHWWGNDVQMTLEPVPEALSPQ